MIGSYTLPAHAGIVNTQPNFAFDLVIRRDPPHEEWSMHATFLLVSVSLVVEWAQNAN